MADLTRSRLVGGEGLENIFLGNILNIAGWRFADLILHAIAV